VRAKHAAHGVCKKSKKTNHKKKSKKQNRKNKSKKTGAKIKIIKNK
jgi:hypothetical protein